MRHLFIIAFIVGSLTQTIAASDKSSYIVVLRESPMRSSETVNSYAQRLQSELQLKIDNLKKSRSSAVHVTSWTFFSANLPTPTMY